MGLLQNKEAVFIALGSNQGDRVHHLKAALGLLSRDEIFTLAVSRLYESDTVGRDNQEKHLNAVAQVQSIRSPGSLLRTMKQIEAELGRDPSAPYAPRPLDLDLLLVGSRVLQTEFLVLPHPRMTTRDFVLAPLCDLAPDLQIPGTATKATEALDALTPSANGLQIYADQGWHQPDYT